MTRLDLVLGCAGLATLVVLAPASRARACCPAFPPAPDTTVKIAEQEILVAWNPATRTEHFVRRASFAAEVAGFGFLVPTPSEPQLSEVETAVFDRLREEIEPRVVHQTRTHYRPTFMCLPPPSAALHPTAATGGPPTMVEVLQQTRVAGYDAAVLKADDAAALAAWLEKNGYDARPALRAWIEPYVAQKWIVTAFKFVAAQGSVATGSVRMSFQTERPLFPYRTPTDQRGGGNILRVFLVGQGRGAGALGTAGSPWKGEVKYSTATPSQGLPTLLGQAVPAVDIPAGAWLTAFEDPTWPGGEEDLWFSADPRGEELIPTITVWDEREVPIPLEPVVLVLGVVALVLVLRRGSRRARDDR